MYGCLPDCKIVNAITVEVGNLHTTDVGLGGRRWQRRATLTRLIVPLLAITISITIAASCIDRPVRDQACAVGALPKIANRSQAALAGGWRARRETWWR